MKNLPFTITPDTEFFMNRAGYQDALNVLLVAIRSGEGFIKVTGEVGVGKTLLCRKLMNTLGEGFESAYIHNPYLNPETLLYAIADELDISYDDTVNQNGLLKRITETLISHNNQGKRVVVCLDEVQAMPLKTLEALRLLTNLETEKRKLIQVVLFGQPELESVLAQPSIRQLRQRITFSYQLLPLNKVAMKTYIQHRLIIAGFKSRDLFPKATLGLLYQASNGIPRLINILCHKALIAAYGEGSQIVKAKHMQLAVKDTLEAQKTKPVGFTSFIPSVYRWFLGTIGSVALAVVALQLSS